MLWCFRYSENTCRQSAELWALVMMTNDGRSFCITVVYVAVITLEMGLSNTTIQECGLRRRHCITTSIKRGNSWGEIWRANKRKSFSSQSSPSQMVWDIVMMWHSCMGLVSSSNYAKLVSQEGLECKISFFLKLEGHVFNIFRHQWQIF